MLKDYNVKKQQIKEKMNKFGHDIEKTAEELKEKFQNHTKKLRHKFGSKHNY